MKANEAPEKIILSADRDTQIIYNEWVINDYTDNIKIEYSRTDAFIKKACDYLSYRLDTSKIDVNYKFKFIEDFRNYMEK